ncbi:MAG: GrpB family protein [Burkholderiaceae bacterium]
MIFQPDSAGPIRCRIEAQLLRLVLADLEPTIEHIGSMAVAEIAAEPIIDILVGVPSLQRFAPGAGRLANYGYEYVPAYEATQPERRLFKRVAEGVRTHHLHVIEVGGKDWNRYLSFRNRLRTNAPLAQSYAQLKYRPALRYRNDRNAYTAGKTDFVESALTGRRDPDRP